MIHHHISQFHLVSSVLAIAHNTSLIKLDFGLQKCFVQHPVNCCIRVINELPSVDFLGHIINEENLWVEESVVGGCHYVIDVCVDK